VAVTRLQSARTSPYRKLTLLKTEDSSVQKHKLRWLGSVEIDLKNMGVRNWRPK
jgi:hypothetical protein